MTFTEVMDEAERWCATKRRAVSNPACDIGDDEDADSIDFIEHLVDEGLETTALSEEQWRGVAGQLGLRGIAIEQFIEDVASWS